MKPYPIERSLPPKKQRSLSFLFRGLTYEELDRRARAVAALIREHVPPGKPVILLYPSDLKYIVASFGCLYASVIAVPAYPPLTSVMSKHLEAIIADSQADTVLTSHMLSQFSKTKITEGSTFGKLRWLSTDTLPENAAEFMVDKSTNQSSPAFIQYTSGSTSDPKGVCLTHGNILHNLEPLRHQFETSTESKGAFWLPLYHDMGLWR